MVYSENNGLIFEAVRRCLAEIKVVTVEKACQFPTSRYSPDQICVRILTTYKMLLNLRDRPEILAFQWVGSSRRALGREHTACTHAARRGLRNMQG